MSKQKQFKWIAVLAFMAIFSASFFGQQGQQGLHSIDMLRPLIDEARWDDLAPFFSDPSYLVLKNYFAKCKSIKIISTEHNMLTYKAKFSRQGEMGVIAVNEKDGKFFGLKIKNQIQPMYFIDKFKKYRARNVSIKIGNAQLQFIDGYFYETIPYRALLFFEGSWTFYIKPDDKEEQLTLVRQYKKDFFTEKSRSGVFILNDKSFLRKLPREGETTTLGKECDSIYTRFRNNYGIKIKPYEEYWFLPFPEGSNFVIFRKDKNNFYQYSFNKNLIPDTQLAVTETGQLILNYNKIKGMKFTFGAKEKVNEVKMGISYNPYTSAIFGTSTITYDTPSNLQILNVAPELRMNINPEGNGKDMNVFRKGTHYYIMGVESSELSLHFNGNIKANSKDFELFKTKETLSQKKSNIKIEPYSFLSRTQNFYPNPGNEFFKTSLNINVPRGLNCLATGTFVGVEDKEMSSSFKFECPSTKGVSMVVGKFKPSISLDSSLPIQFYIPELVEFPDGVDTAEIKKATNFLSQVYGPLDIPRLNVLLSDGEKEGGISNTGFVVVYMPFNRVRISTDGYIDLSSGTIKEEPRIHSPILIRDQIEDHIIHEIAHQWWGGVVSWSSYQDTWITEGLAHFSVLYYLKNNIPERQYNRLIKKLKRWVNDFSKSGPIIYGNRIHQLENNNYEAYQAVVYNKSALMFMMLMDLIGEKELNRRLTSVLQKYKFQSISSNQFITQFCDKDEMLLRFFKNWIYTRDLPAVELILKRDHPEYDNKEFKKVVVSIRQVDTNFVFPLKLEVTTMRGGTSIETINIHEKEQELIITRDSPIRAIEILDSAPALVKEKRN